MLFPLTVERRHKVHECQPAGHLLDLLFVAAVALAHHKSIEFKRPKEAHAWIIHELLLDKIELTDALVAVL